MMKNILPSLACILMISLSSSSIAQSSSGWAVKLGAYTTNESMSIALDANGNSYTTGFYNATTDFDPGAGVYNLTTVGQSMDVYIQKLDPSGHLVWAKSIGGPGDDIGYSITLDADGNILLTGIYTDSADMDPGVNRAMSYANGGTDIFIVKLDSAGNYIWSKSIGSNGFDNGRFVKTDAAGNVYLTGSFSDTIDLDPGTGTSEAIAVGNYDIFIDKLDKNGNYLWGFGTGSAEDNESGMSMAVDAAGNLYMTGYYMDVVDFDPSPNTHSLTTNGQEDIFVLKLDSGGHFIWVKGYGGTDLDHGTSLSLDASGHIYVTGNFGNTVAFGSDTLTTKGSYDIFILKLDTAGHDLWVKGIGGPNADVGFYTALNGNGDVYTCGVFSDTIDFDPGTGVFDLINTTGSYYNSFIVKLNGSGNFISAGEIGCNDISAINAIAVSTSDDLYMTGRFLGTAHLNEGISTDYISTDTIYTNSFTTRWERLWTGIQTVAEQYLIKTYPNPSHMGITLDLGKEVNVIQIEVTSVSGKKIIDAGYEHARIIDLKLDAPAGLYLLKMTEEDGQSQVMKLIKQ